MPARRDRTSTGEDPRFYDALGRAIQVARTEQGLSRKELARRAGISYAYLSDIETGRGRPSSAALIGVAQALGFSPSVLLALAERYRERIEAEEAGPMERLAAEGPSAEPARAFGAVSPPRTLWFHERALGEGDAFAAHRLRDRGTAPPEPPGTAALRAELHALLEELPEGDLRLILELARRLAGRARP